MKVPLKKTPKNTPKSSKNMKIITDENLNFKIYIIQLFYNLYT